MNKFALLIVGFFFLLSSVASFAGGVNIPGGLYREFVAKPGDVVQGKILVANNSLENQGVKIYQTDYLYFADGTSKYEEPGTASRSSGKWLEFSPTQMVVPVNGNETVNFLIRVPKDSKLEGSYWSVIMVEGLAKDSPELTPEPGKIRLGIRTVIRYAIQIVVNIGSSGSNSLRFLEKAINLQNGKKQFEIVLENNGQRGIKPSIWAELYDLKGISLGRFGGQQTRLLPGCSSKFSIDFSEVPKGKYLALVVADNGDENVFGARYQIELP